MFWSRNNKDKNSDKQVGPKNNNKHGLQEGKSVGTTGQRTSEDIRAEALANAQRARETIGEDTIQKIAEAIRKKQNNPVERAKAQIAEADTDRVLDELKWMMGDKD